MINGYRFEEGEARPTCDESYIGGNRRKAAATVYTSARVDLYHARNRHLARFRQVWPTCIHACIHATPGFEQMCIRLLAPARKGGSDFLAGATVPPLLTFQRVQWPASPPIWNSVQSPTSSYGDSSTYLVKLSSPTDFFLSCHLLP